MGEEELAGRLKGNFLGWGSGGPSNLRKQWEEKVGKRAKGKNTVRNLKPFFVCGGRERGYNLGEQQSAKHPRRKSTSCDLLRGVKSEVVWIVDGG